MLSQRMMEKASVLHSIGFKTGQYSNYPMREEVVQVDVVAVHPDLWSKIVVLLRELSKVNE
jgi:hypothetical protein